MFARLQCWVDVLKVFIMEYTYKHINIYTCSCTFRISSQNSDELLNENVSTQI